MKTGLQRGITLLALCALTGAACQGQSTATLAEADQASIRQAADAWVAAAKAMDSEAMAALYDADAMLLPPNHEVVKGSTAIAEFFVSFPPFTDLQAQQIELDGRGDMAYARGSFSMMIQLPDGVSVPERGKYMEIWRKQADGSWKILRDMFSSDLPLAEPPMAETPGEGM